MRAAAICAAALLLGAASPVPVTELVLDGASVADVATVALRDVERVPYTLMPEVYADSRLVSVRITGGGPAFHKAFVSYLSELGYAVSEHGGIFAVAPKPEAEKPVVPRYPLVYRPLYRDVSYLVEQVSSLLPDCEFSSRRGVSAPRPAASLSRLDDNGGVTSNGGAGGSVSGQAPSNLPGGMYGGGAYSAIGQIDKVVDTLVAYCTEKESGRLRDLLGQVDTREGDLVVRATVFEVTASRADGSALQLAASVLGGKLGLTFGPAASLADSLFVKTKSLNVVLSALGSDSRFKSLSSPVAHARSGTAATFQSGEEVPVLGAVSYPGAGNAPVQSVQYRNAGVIFEVTPVKREKTIAVDVKQELSSFVQTTTGVNQTPTLTKRALQSSLSVEPGEVVLLGGLTADQGTKTTDGLSFLPGWMRSENNDSSRSEIILVLQVSAGDAAPVATSHLVGKDVP